MTLPQGADTPAKATPANDAAKAPAPSRGRELLKKVIALGFSFGLCFLIVEVYARIMWQSPLHIPKEAVRTPGIFSFRLKTDNDTYFERADGGKFHMVTNARGFRGPLMSSMDGKPLKVLSLGDSFTLGWGTELSEHCTSVWMDGYRRAHADRDVGHAYIACGGWDPHDYYYGYLTEAVETKPDLVVLGVFSGNDEMPPTSPRILDPKLAKSVETMPEPEQPLFYSFDFVRAQLSSSLFIAKLRAKHGKPAAYALYDPDMERQKKDWDTSFFYVDALDKAVRQNGGKLVVLLYPTILQVNAPTALDEAGYDHTAPEKVWGAWCAEHHIDLINPLEALIAHAENPATCKKDTYFTKDRHLSVRGNQVVADVLATELSPIVDRLWAERVHPAATAAP